MRIGYKNKRLEMILIAVNVVTAAMVTATFVGLFGFDKPLLPVGILYTVQVVLLAVFIAEKIIRLFNAASKVEFWRANWFEIPLLLLLIVAVAGAGHWFAPTKDEAAVVRHFAVGIYLVTQVVIKIIRTSINLASGRSPIRVLIASFLALILSGTLLLMLPRASTGGNISFVDALFTATSAVTTTGLIVVDTGRDYSLFGQIIILILFQVGGLGYMVLISSMVFFRRSRIPIGTRVLLGESVVRPKKVDILKFVKSIVIFTLLFELLGSLALGYYWKQYFGTYRGFYEGFFHSVSAFCTAGFSLFSDSMTAYRSSIVLNVIISVICITGGIGFFVLYDLSGFFVNIIRRKRPNRLSAHTKLTVSISAMLILGGTLLIFISEKAGQPEGLLPRLLNASFQSVSSSTTTGFNTVDVGKMSQTGLLTIIVLMFIGASPGGTGGGIKTTAFGLMVLSLYAVLMGKEDVNVFRGRAPPEAIRKAFSVAMAAILWLLVSTLALTATEDASFLDIFFEAASALGTVGLSTGITPELSFAGRIIIAISMLIGRIGPLTIGFSLIGRPKKVAYQYPEADILVG